MEIINKEKIRKKIIENYVLMDYAEEFITEKKKDEIELQMINIVQNYKQIYLAIELVRTKGNSQTQAFKDINEKSIIK